MSFALGLDSKLQCSQLTKRQYLDLEHYKTNTVSSLRLRLYLSYLLLYP